MTASHTIDLPGGIPRDHKPHTESTTTILVPTAQTAFLNPVQQYNRDLSVAVIRTFNETRSEELRNRWRAKQDKGGGRRRKQKQPDEDAGDSEHKADAEVPRPGPSRFREAFRTPQITILEALSATGLRSIRYAKEIDNVKLVLANDLSPSACEAMKMNVRYNSVGEDDPDSGPSVSTSEQETSLPVEEVQPIISEEEAMNGASAHSEYSYGRRFNCKGRVRVNQGDACAFMYQQRADNRRIEVVDLDPYGTAVPFIDAAINCVADGGLLCVTCTDMAVLAGSHYPEKCFSNYGGVSVNAEYSHEVALRLMLNSLATTAGRYGKYIVPLLSLSIDFYCRVFIRVHNGAEKVKYLSSQTGITYSCSYCHSFLIQPFGRTAVRENKKGGTYDVHKAAVGPVGEGSKCEECGSTMHVGGPMWLGPLHDTEFVGRVLKGIEGDKEHYGTWSRMWGMLTIAQNEISDPFYFTSNKIHGALHAISSPSSQVISALLNANYRVSRSHASQGSIKTDAPRSFIYDIVREHIKKVPVRMDKVPEDSPARKLIEKEITHKIDFTPHPDVAKFERGEKVVFYQVNPTPHWGPGSRAKTVIGQKRKSDEAVNGFRFDNPNAFNHPLDDESDVFQSSFGVSWIF
ncbi:hypothetical protein TREMEDRAFT_68241 [Tremella mesenterica DSM 1558]|uniref:uncharacterized protein n=1 Tax=Tremella mesenterica (strain ATCC 24925 / CBS 8224 / DSM 1558 / NBRC 9311 / NRRL Y-6157 / RJB 2259-6 / UBC 559-6) TaxID=578456 RepID=UPI0003F49546|nr:uncharacterized protein TREMEDRAFT_68241 [Tremella mesenterica DSM 1558]EIW70842.1 hypothetical protein TREMEDRAFT_68241 [Tremella mesenterica DSM 1558]